METVRKIESDGIKFTVTFDEYGVLDTIERNGSLINSQHRDSRRIFKNADAILAGVLPKNFKWQDR